MEPDFEKNAFVCFSWRYSVQIILAVLQMTYFKSITAYNNTHGSRIALRLPGEEGPHVNQEDREPMGTTQKYNLSPPIPENTHLAQHNLLW